MNITSLVVSKHKTNSLRCWHMDYHVHESFRRLTPYELLFGTLPFFCLLSVCMLAFSLYDHKFHFLPFFFWPIIVVRITPPPSLPPTSSSSFFLSPLLLVWLAGQMTTSQIRSAYMCVFHYFLLSTFVFQRHFFSLLNDSRIVVILYISYLMEYIFLIKVQIPINLSKAPLNIFSLNSLPYFFHIKRKRRRIRHDTMNQTTMAIYAATASKSINVRDI